MYLFLTLETQTTDLSAIRRRINKELSFVTDGQNLEEIDNYGTEFRSISVIPSCMDDNFWNILGWKERKQIWRKDRRADIRLRMDYDRFMRETPENQRLLYIDILVKSIRVVQERSKGDFRGNELIRDILNALNVTEEQLQQINAQ